MFGDVNIYSEWTAKDSASRAVRVAAKTFRLKHRKGYAIPTIQVWFIHFEWVTKG